MASWINISFYKIVWRGQYNVFLDFVDVFVELVSADLLKLSEFIQESCGFCYQITAQAQQKNVGFKLYVKCYYQPYVISMFNWCLK